MFVIFLWLMTWGDVYKKFLDRLDGVYKNHLTVLQYIPGTFTAEQAQQILGNIIFKDKPFTKWYFDINAFNTYRCT